jgi:hypothetical protein
MLVMLFAITRHPALLFREEIFWAAVFGSALGFLEPIFGVIPRFSRR